MKEVEYTHIELGNDRKKKKGYSVMDGSVEVRVNDMKPFKMTILPRNKAEASLGRLFCMGLISSFEDVLDIEEEGSTVKFKINPKEKKLERLSADWKVTPEIIIHSMKKLFESTDIWRITGGVHSAGLLDSDGNLLYNADDIGKGNAIDAVIGMALREGLDFTKCILASTGRQIGFMVEKAVRAGTPFVIARGAPLYSAIEVSERYNVTLVCFVKGRSMNVYTHGERIT